MTNTVQKEETPNPYNAKKTWHQGEDKPFKSADDGLFFEEPTDRNKLFDTDDITEVNAEGSVNKQNLETEKDAPYKKPADGVNCKCLSDCVCSETVPGNSSIIKANEPAKAQS
jgi:hypothetical protein